MVCTATLLFLIGYAWRALVQDYIVPFSHRIAATGEEMHKTAIDIVQGCVAVPFNGTALPPPIATNTTKGVVPLLQPGASTHVQPGGRKLLLA